MPARLDLQPIPPLRTVGDARWRRPGQSCASALGSKKTEEPWLTQRDAMRCGAKARRLGLRGFSLCAAQRCYRSLRHLHVLDRGRVRRVLAQLHLDQRHLTAHRCGCAHEDGPARPACDLSRPIANRAPIRPSRAVPTDGPVPSDRDTAFPTKTSARPTGHSERPHEVSDHGDARSRAAPRHRAARRPAKQTHGTTPRRKRRIVTDRTDRSTPGFKARRRSQMGTRLRRVPGFHAAEARTSASLAKAP